MTGSQQGAGNSHDEPSTHPGGPVIIDREEMFLALKTAPAQVRAWLRGSLVRLVPDAVMLDAVVVATELVTNSVLHTSTRGVRVMVTLARRSLRLTVLDQGPGPPWPPHSADLRRIAAERGRGLAMVDRLASTAEPIEDHGWRGLRVTFEVDGGRDAARRATGAEASRPGRRQQPPGRS